MNYIGTIWRDNTLMNEKKIVIYGAGKTGKKILGAIKELGYANKVCCFCDSSSSQIGNRIDEISIMKLSEAAAQYQDAAYVVASCCVKEMVQNLQKHQISNIHIDIV